MTADFVPTDAVNYTSLSVATAGNFIIAKATLTITADNQTKVEGSPNPTFTISYIGFVAGESASNLLTTPTTTCSANINSTAGTYPIIVSGATAANYTIIYQNGTLTITAPLIMKFEIPNAFIPTDIYADNRFLKASFNASVQNVSFRIYNRIGKLVIEFVGLPSAINWDGRDKNGVLQESDVYMWVADITGLGGTLTQRKGQFLLLK
jgi:pectate lyase